MTNCPEQWFGKWKGVIASILTSLIDVFGVMTCAPALTIGS
jgi:hypothetical protein